MAFVLALAQTRLWFAGEATSKEDAYTVHGAYKTGGCCAVLGLRCAALGLCWGRAALGLSWQGASCLVYSHGSWTET